MRKDKVVSEMLGEETPIAPSDLYNTDFRRVVFGGYDRNEVDAFLERVGDVFEDLIKQTRELRERQTQQKEQLDAFREMETSLRDALITSQRFGEHLTENAQREADALLAEAQLQKTRAELEAKELRLVLQEEIGALQAERNRLRADLASVLDTHRDLLKQLPTAEAVLEAEAQAMQTPSTEDDVALEEIEEGEATDIVAAEALE